MTDKRILILEDGQVTIGGVVCRLVRLSDLHFLPSHLRVDLLKDAAAIDLSSLPRAPERVQDVDGDDEYFYGWNDALDAMGLK